MKEKKIFSIYLFFLFLIIFIPVESYSENAKKIIFTIIFTFIAAPVAYYFFKKEVMLILELSLYALIFFLPLPFAFRQIRSLVNPPLIGNNQIVGYVHYYGYPLYFETILLFLILLSPLIFVLFIKLRKSLLKL